MGKSRRLAKQQTIVKDILEVGGELYYNKPEVFTSNI
jgi:hypothetical protein